jgi:methyl acetate hydrolase
MGDLEHIDEVLRSAINHRDVPGVVAMAATRAGVAYQGAFGQRTLPDGAAMTTDTVFWIASMTKAIMSTAAMQLVERGRLALDRPIADVLPELASPQVLEGFDPSGEPRLRPARRPITLRHLLTHTAGFVYDIWNAEMGRYMEVNGIPGIILAKTRRSHSHSSLIPATVGITGSTSIGSARRWNGRAVSCSATILPSISSGRSA